MGGLQNEVQRTGAIFLQKQIAGEFDRTLASTKHGSADTFLEYLLELFLKSEKDTEPVKVRDDLALKFLALQCRSSYQSSDELMKRLLDLFGQNQQTSETTNEKPKPTQGKTTQSQQYGRKSRKSQPKRNYRHAALIESDDESGDRGGGSRATRQEGAWRERSVSSIEEGEVTVQDNGEMETNFDLSKVKHEVDDEENVKAKQNDKDSRVDSGPLCLSLHNKPITVKDGGRLHTDLDDMVERKTATLYEANNQHSITRSSPKMARNYNQQSWRSRSEPLDHSSFLHNKHENYAFKRESMLERDNGEDMNDYNYVLSLGPESLPPSPMQTPGRYAKSTPYAASSDDEDAPEDLSISSSHNNQPENLTVSKPNGPPSGLAKDHNAIKYDSNANAVAVPIAQLSNGQLIAQTHIPIPQNLLFHDPRTVGGMVGQPQLLPMGSKSVAQPLPGSIPTSSINSHHAPMVLASMRGPPPLLMPSMLSPTSNSQILVPINSLTHNSLPSQGTPKATSSDDNQSLDGSGQRKKRKKMEDTTVFRDPPEQSLPFNGPNKYRFYCNVCDTGFTRRYTFNRHKCKGRVEKHYCQLCDKAYLSKYKLKDHILVKHEGQTVSCPECGKRFSSRSSMEMHKKQQHEGQYSIFCKVCGKGFNHTGHYYGHMNKHTNTKPFWCQQCGKRFYGSSYLHNHKQVCRGNNDLNYTCTICDRKFKCELYLKKHMKIHDSTPIIANPNVAKPTDEDLKKAGVSVAELSGDSMSNGEAYNMGMAVFPNGPDYSDSSSNSALMIDEKTNEKEVIQQTDQNLKHKT